MGLAQGGGGPDYVTKVIGPDYVTKVIGPSFPFLPLSWPCWVASQGRGAEKGMAVLLLLIREK